MLSDCSNTFCQYVKILFFTSALGNFVQVSFCQNTVRALSVACLPLLRLNNWFTSCLTEEWGFCLNLYCRTADGVITLKNTFAGRWKQYPVVNWVDQPEYWVFAFPFVCCSFLGLYCQLTMWYWIFIVCCRITCISPLDSISFP